MIKYVLLISTPIANWKNTYSCCISKNTYSYMIRDHWVIYLNIIRNISNAEDRLKKSVLPGI
jgi:hypothetical protein